jgi:tellurite resistance protein TerB
MTNILASARSAVIKEIGRFRNRHLLEAAMAAGALLAAADGEVLISERLALDFLLENVKQLRDFEVHKAVDLFQDYAEALRRDPAAGRKRVMDTVTRFAADPQAAHLLIRACMVIAGADGEFSENERRAIGDLCGVLGVDVAQFGI